MLGWPPSWPWFLCLIILCLVLISSFLYLLRVEGRNPLRKGSKMQGKASQQCGAVVNQRNLPSGTHTKISTEDDHFATIPTAVVFEQELWQTCYGTLHPGVLLVYRLLAFTYLTVVMLWDFHNISWRAYYFFTEWNFTMLILYFMIATYFSARACLSMPATPPDKPQEGSYSPLPDARSVPLLGSIRGSGHEDQGASSSEPKYLRSRKAEEEEGSWVAYAMQASYQIALPMAVLVDCVFWLVLFPEAIRYDTVAYQLTFVRLTQHAVNLAVVSGEFTLNSLRFPAFRMAYMLLWSVIFVLFQWVNHDVLGWSWAYGFLTNDTLDAPLWYLGLLGFHLICYWLWVELHRVKQWIFPMSAQWCAYLQSTSDEIYECPIETSVMDV